MKLLFLFYSHQKVHPVALSYRNFMIGNKRYFPCGHIPDLI